MINNEEIKVEIQFDFGQNVNLDYTKFIEFSVGTKNIKESNDFLKSMWREFNLEVSHDGKNRCGWFYGPRKIRIKNRNISYLGIMDSKIGRIYVAVSYKKQGSIDNIMFFMTQEDFEVKHKSLFKRLVRQAKANITKLYLYEVKLSLRGKCLDLDEAEYCLLHSYAHEKFVVYEENSNCKMKFKILAYDFVDANKSAIYKINQVVNFLSIETNIYYEYEDIEVSDINNNIQYECNKINFIYQDNIVSTNQQVEDGEFIDWIPLYKNKVLLSKKGIELIGKILDSDTDEVKNFLDGCYHFRQGLEREYQLKERIMITSSQQMLRLASTDIKNGQNILDIAVTFYLSAIETTTLKGSEVEKCESCGQLKYQIGHRVFKFMNTYFDPENGGNLFKKIYELRSRYLHAGESVSSYSVGQNYPLLDDRTGTGCVDQGFISLNIEGNVAVIVICNIREWVSYSLRKYYREEFEEVLG